jgi:hypothetical protein
MQFGWNIKQLDEKCPESLYVDERERESACVWSRVQLRIKSLHKVANYFKG